MAINYDDSRFTNLEKEEQSAKNQSNSTYDSLIKDSGKYYDNLINQSKEWADKQADIQNQQTEFAVQKIEQQKDQAAKDYTKEQKGAYQDYMKQSNAYGSSMQAAGQQGLGGSGWSETIQSGFYNTYQNRYAQARESYNEILMNYNNNIKEAQLQNSSALATIYADAQREQLELALQSFTVIKDLKLEKQNKYLTIDEMYNNRWRDVEQQINTENALAEQIRQYNASLAEQKRQADLDQAYRNASLQLERDKFNYQKAQDAAAASSLSSGGGSSKSSSSSSKSSSSKSSSSSSLSSKSSKSSSSSSTIKLVNGKTGYTSAVTAYQKAGGKTPYSASALVSKGYVKTHNLNGKTYYYVP
jgi:hypothetical protein